MSADLSSACSALGSIMSALGARRLLARGIKNDTLRAAIEAKTKTDAEIEKIAADAFEAAGKRLTVSASDLRAAIDNATNTARFG